jgi:hypothetical protein
MSMRPILLRSTAALALILPALVTNAMAQQKKPAGPAPAVHAAPAAPPHIAAPAAHIAAPAPVARVAAPQPHFAAPAARIAAPAHVATPHVATQQISRPNISHTNSNIAHTNVGHGNVASSAARQQQIEAHRNNAGSHDLAHRGPTTPNGTNAARTVTAPNKSLPNEAASKLATPNKALPNTPPPNVAGQGTGNRGRNAVTQQAQTKVQQQAQAQARSQIYAGRGKPVLHNQTFAQASTRDPAARALARATFQGGFAQFHSHDRGNRFADRRGFHGIVIGWGGPVFWPYAYADLVDYTYWPAANDTFWPYAYDDLYDGIFGAYAPDATAYADVPAVVRRSVPRGVATGVQAGGMAQVCSGQTSGLTDWPIERIAQQVMPTDQQSSLLDQLKDATTKAVDLLKSNCPTDVPSTPTGRLDAMRQRIEPMLQAVQMVRPALDKFYDSLSDEQKERFIALESEGAPKASSAARKQPDLTQACGGSAQQIAGLPINQIQQVVHPNDAQQAALDALNNATTQAASALNQTCSPTDQPLTPPGRVAAMEARLSGMLKALDTVQPAMAKFYGSLTDEQKARFDRLPPRRG